MNLRQAQAVINRIRTKQRCGEKIYPADWAEFHRAEAAIRRGVPVKKATAPKEPKHGYFGITLNGSKYTWYVYEDGKQKRVSGFDTAEQAALARENYLKEHPEICNGNTRWNFGGETSLPPCSGEGDLQSGL